MPAGKMEELEKLSQQIAGVIELNKRLKSKSRKLKEENERLSRSLKFVEKDERAARRMKKESELFEKSKQTIKTKVENLLTEMGGMGI